MSRIAKALVSIPIGVDVKINGQTVTVMSKNDELTLILNDYVEIKQKCNVLTFNPRNNCVNGWAQTGTARSLVKSMIIGVTEGFTKKLQLVGVGYRVSVKDNMVNLFLGFSHPINHQLPTGIIAKCPSHTEIVLKGANKQMVYQVAADLRSYRRPEPYKGKGIRYDDEFIIIKDAKKK